MMDLEVLLKRLIIANIVLFFVIGFFEMMFFESLPVELQNYNNRMAEDERENFILMIAGVPMFVMYLASFVFLWKLKRSGRTMFTAIWVISLLLTAALMPQVYHQLTALTISISTLINGLMFGLIYFSDLRFYFEKNRSENI